MRDRIHSTSQFVVGLATCAFLALLFAPGGRTVVAQPANSDETFQRDVRPLLKKYCLGCHSTEAKKGSLDLERFAAVADVRKDVKPWLSMIEQLEAGEMPPKSKPQPGAGEKKLILEWVRGFMDAEARARAGDPGFVPLRRLSNAEYDATIRDLTGVDLRPTREFPADGAAGEGFTNAAEALTDMSPTLLNKYLSAAKEIAEHAILLPQGFRFSAEKTRRDKTNEATAQIQAFYAPWADAEGRPPLAAYIVASVRHRDALLAGRATIQEVATAERLNAKYLGEIWKALNDRSPSYPLDAIRARWRQATDHDVARFVAEITAWQNVVWNLVTVGSYRYPIAGGFAESTSRQMARDPAVAAAQPIRMTIKPAPGQDSVVIYLAARDLLPVEGSSGVVWQRPRFEAPNQPPLLLRDYAKFGAEFEWTYPSIFARTATYLTAAREAAFDRTKNVDELAKAHGLDSALLNRWISLLALEPRQSNASMPGRAVPLAPLHLLDARVEKAANKAAINGWHKKGSDLPILMTNASSTEERIPGKAAAHGVLVHPSPKEFVGVVWKSSLAGPIRIAARVTDAHDTCGNGVAWWLELRRGDQAWVLADGVVDNGREAQIPECSLTVGPGDQIVFGIDARRGDHVCDLTDIALSITEIAQPARNWDLAADVVETVLAGNPHGDRHGHADTWSFVRGPSRSLKADAPTIPPGSLLAKWRELASDPARAAEAAAAGEKIQRILTGSRPAAEAHPDRLAYDRIVSLEGPLLRGLNLKAIGRSGATKGTFGLKPDRFHDADLPAAANSVIELRVPVALINGREFVVEGRAMPLTANRVVRFQVQTTQPSEVPTGPQVMSSVVAVPDGAGYRQFVRGLDEFRAVFPHFVCFPKVIPTDEVVSLKMFHREDEPLRRLFLDETQTNELDRLWREHRFISRQPAAENAYLPQFIGFVTQDQTKEMLAYYEGLRPEFKRRAEEFAAEESGAMPSHLEALLGLATKAYRRPLREQESANLRDLYRAIRGKGASHDEAIRGVLARILVAPAFLFRIEQAPAGNQPAPVSDWELASRLSYFLWSSMPDDELRGLAAAGRLRDPKILAAQIQRMLQDGRVRALAIEFGTQWIHVRGFDERSEKNERLFPTFDTRLRSAIYEESVLFFKDLFQNDRPVALILDADHTFLNDILAKHYGIPGVIGPEWRKVDGVRKYGRGGLLGLASVQTQQSGASRTSPILRGNWVVETLLGEKLPRPPANVPKLPEEEGGSDQLTVKQLVERHTKQAECAVCHQRIDPFGFAMEQYDAIGRLRDKDLGGLAVDAKAKLRDDTEFEGMAGLRDYLLANKRNEVTRLFCRRLLGYALGRSVTLSDNALVDDMVAELAANDGRITAAVQAIARSPQFRMVRGRDLQD